MALSSEHAFLIIVGGNVMVRGGGLVGRRAGAHRT